MNKEVENLEKKQKEILELKSTITEIETFTEEIQRQICSGRRVSKHEDRTMEIFKAKEKE